MPPAVGAESLNHWTAREVADWFVILLYNKTVITSITFSWVLCVYTNQNMTISFSWKHSIPNWWLGSRLYQPQRVERSPRWLPSQIQRHGNLTMFLQWMDFPVQGMTICMWRIFPSYNSNWEPENPTPRALDTGAMNRDVARVEAKGRMTSPILAMRAVRTRRSCPQQGGEGGWQPSEEGGCHGKCSQT